MGLLAPWFLAGLAGVSLPVFLHLLKRQKNPPKLVSSLMLYESRDTARRGIAGCDYLLLLALRLLLLLLLILAFANPFVNRNAAAMASNRLVLLAIDNSFSMRAKPPPAARASRTRKTPPCRCSAERAPRAGRWRHSDRNCG